MKHINLIEKLITESLLEIESEKTKLNESKHPHSSLLRLINQNIVDAETKVIYPLKEIINILNKPSLTKKEKKQIEKLLSEYKDYFDRSKGGTSTVRRGFKMQNEIENILKSK